MKLYIRQETFTIGDKFHVRDENGADRYFVRRPPLSRSFNVYNMRDEHVARISRHFLRMLFDVEISGSFVVSIQKRLTLFREHYDLLDTDWELNGDFTAHEYTLSNGSEIIMTISKEWFTWGDCYALDIADPQNELLSLCIVLAVDAVKDAQSK